MGGGSWRLKLEWLLYFVLVLNWEKWEYVYVYGAIQQKENLIISKKKKVELSKESSWLCKSKLNLTLHGRINCQDHQEQWGLSMGTQLQTAG